MDKKSITREIKDLQDLESLANAYAQISSNRMRKTRDSVVLSRDFYFEIQAIFKELQLSYRDKFIALARKRGIKKGQKITLLAHNGKSVAVFLSANTAFYGDLTKRVFDLFLKEVKEKNYEATIVGTLGLSMFREVASDLPYSYFELPDYGTNQEKVGELVRHLVEYEEIHIFFGKFKSVVNQYPDQVVISAETPIGEKETMEVAKYLFEPTLEEILMFFEREMFSSIFEQTISESQLAKFASRMIAMDAAGERIRNTLLEKKTTNLRVVHAISNKKQLESMASIISATKRSYAKN